MITTVGELRKALDSWEDTALVNVGQRDDEGEWMSIIHVDIPHNEQEAREGGCIISVR